MNKVYVDVVAEFSKEGCLIPILFVWKLYCCFIRADWYRIKHIQVQKCLSATCKSQNATYKNDD